jgi:hypothetical protein
MTVLIRDERDLREALLEILKTPPRTTWTAGSLADKLDHTHAVAPPLANGFREFAAPDGIRHVRACLRSLEAAGKIRKEEYRGNSKLRLTADVYFVD